MTFNKIYGILIIEKNEGGIQMIALIFCFLSFLGFVANALIVYEVPDQIKSKTEIIVTKVLFYFCSFILVCSIISLIIIRNI